MFSITIFTESTHQFKDPETGDQTIEQYLNFLKAQGILQILRNSEHFQQTRHGSLYRRSIAQVEQQRISKEYQQRDLVRFEEQELKTLNNAALLIWAPVPVKHVRVV